MSNRYFWLLLLLGGLLLFLLLFIASKADNATEKISYLEDDVERLDEENKLLRVQLNNIKNIRWDTGT